MFNKATRTKHSALLSCVLLFSVIVGSRSASAQSGVYTPKAGGPERKAIMDALRGPVEKDLQRNASPAAPEKGPKIPIIFEVSVPQTNFRVKQDWAFLYATICHPNGQEIDYDFPVASGLLHRTQGRWQVVCHDTGGEGEPWTQWSRQYHAPPSLFPKPR